MTQFIFAVVVVYLLFLFPQIVLVAGLILGGFWLYTKYELVDKEKKSSEKIDDLGGWTAEKASEEWVDTHLDKDVLITDEFRGEGKKIAAEIYKKQQEADEEMKRDIEAEDRGEKTPFAQKSTTKKVEKPPIAPTKPPISTPPETQDLTDQEIYAIMQQLSDE